MAGAGQARSGGRGLPKRYLKPIRFPADGIVSSRWTPIRDLAAARSRGSVPVAEEGSCGRCCS